MTRYTLWKSFKGNTGDAELLESESLFVTRKNAFKRAKQLVGFLSDSNDTILVRKVTIGKDEVEQWEFTIEDA